MASILRKIMIITGITVITAFVCFEIGLRVLSKETQAGTLLYNTLRVRPYRIPVEQIQEDIDYYLAHQDEAVMVYDPLLGWTYGTDIDQPTISTNSVGMRDNHEYTRTPPDDITRIAVFGDSFIAGEELMDDETFTVQLQAALAERDIAAEVLNFGVSGYGVDQAYLRWQHVGRDYQPDIVLMGFQSENMIRNVNTYRNLFCSCGIPFFKPRFTLAEDGQLVLHVSPTPEPQAIPEILTHFDDHPIAAYEWFYPGRYRASSLDWSYTWRFIDAYIDIYHRAHDVFVPALTENDERVQLTDAILRRFAQESAQAEQDFAIIHMPPIQMVAAYLTDSAFPYQSLLDDLDADLDLIHGEAIFTIADDNDWMSNFHYAPQTQARLASLVADWLIAEKDLR